MDSHRFPEQRARASQMPLWPDATFDGNRTRHFRTSAQAWQDAHAINLASPRWQTTRRETIVREKFECWRCQKVRRLQVHHLTYAHEGDEWPSDVVAVCRTCHEIMSSEERNTWRGRRYWGC